VREPDATPPRAFETIPQTEAPRASQTSPSLDYTEARPTSYDIAAGGTALIPDAQDSGGGAAIVEPPSTIVEPPSTPTPTPTSTSTPASSFSSSSSLPSSPSLPPPPSQPSAGSDASSPGFTESPSFYATPPTDSQGFQTTPLNTPRLSQFQESQPTAAERLEPAPASASPPTVARRPHVVPSVVTPARSRVPIPALVGAGVLALLCVVAGLYFAFKPTEDDTNTNVRANLNANVVANANRAANNNANVGPTPDSGFKPDLVSVPGGTFMMGRNDVPPRSSQVSVAYQAWVYNQWPAHPVNVLPFSMDRTEVTNGEYAEFVEKTNHAPPAHWGGKRPPAGQEKWPVGGVALADAAAFARWRSERDGAQYRLPTEEEWEYAARGGDATRLYPWGAEWADGRANLEADSLRDVGSFPEGATPQGALDMLGNVWEWTTTEAGMYRGNNLLMLASGDRGKVVVRGGSYQSKARGEEPITSTARRWVPRTERNPLVGFRLVRVGS
jgi:formylglycine-generating enzyme required for sulfatase activity